MTKDSVEIEFIKGQAVSPRRGIAWLKIKDNSVVNAKTVFDGLKESRQMYLRTSFDQWIAFKDIPDRHHGWPREPDFKACHQFNYKDGSGRNRLYGFKWHPGIPDNGFEICVLAMHANKNQSNTDPFYKRVMIRFLNNDDIRAAIKKQVAERFGTK